MWAQMGDTSLPLFNSMPSHLSWMYSQMGLLLLNSLPSRWVLVWSLHNFLHGYQRINLKQFSQIGISDWFWNLAMSLKLINLPENKLDGNVSKELINSELIDWALTYVSHHNPRLSPNITILNIALDYYYREISLFFSKTWIEIGQIVLKISDKSPSRELHHNQMH